MRPINDMTLFSGVSVLIDQVPYILSPSLLQGISINLLHTKWHQIPPMMPSPNSRETHRRPPKPERTTDSWLRICKYLHENITTEKPSQEPIKTTRKSLSKNNPVSKKQEAFIKSVLEDKMIADEECDSDNQQDSASISLFSRYYFFDIGGRRVRTSSPGTLYFTDDGAVHDQPYVKSDPREMMDCLLNGKSVRLILGNTESQLNAKKTRQRLTDSEKTMYPLAEDRVFKKTDNNKIKEERPSYKNFYTEIKKHDDTIIAEQIRKVLMDENYKLPAEFKSIASLISALFIAEVSRNPTCLLSGLMLLDLIQSGYHDEICFTWKNCLWHPDSIDSESNHAENDKLGGYHPMAHQGSFVEFEADLWQQDESSWVRQKEINISSLWLSIKLKQLGYDAQPISVKHKQEMDNVTISNNSLSPELNDIISTLLNERLMTFAPMLSSATLSAELENVKKQKISLSSP